MKFMPNTEYYEKTELNNDDLNIFFGGKELSIPEGFNFGPYVHDFYDFHYCTKGNFELHINNRLFEIKEGMLFVIPPLANTRKFFTSPSTSSLYITLKGSMLKEYFSAIGFSENNFVFPYEVPKSCVELLDQIINLLTTHIEISIDKPDSPIIPEVISYGSSSDSLARRMKRRGFFQVLLSELMTVYAVQSDKTQKLPTQQDYINRAIKYIEANYNYDINVDEVAKHVGLNRSYLYTLFNNTLDISIQEFIMQTRMRMACSLLKNSGTPIKSIAASVRYDPISFSRAFKKCIGTTPTEYRKKNSVV
ncbi:MAG: helix-turn-helix domain-containing protein [Oscillospiraceae bacterium]|nr:helix-turn-helix domain-containing protein [Oscillospiraceae bacterium]